MKGRDMFKKDFRSFVSFLAGRVSRYQGLELEAVDVVGRNGLGNPGLRQFWQHICSLNQLTGAVAPGPFFIPLGKHLAQEASDKRSSCSVISTPWRWKSDKWNELKFSSSLLLGTLMFGGGGVLLTGAAVCEPNIESSPAEEDGKPSASPAPAEPTSNSHTARWRVFTDMGRDLFAQGRVDEAEKYFVRALEEARAGFGEDDPHVASSCNNLAELYRLRKDYARAEPLFIEAVARLKKAFGPNHQSVGLALHNLAAVYLLQRNFDKAAECYVRALEVKGKMMGTSHPEYANTLFHLAEVRLQQGKPEEAAQMLTESVKILEDGGLGYSEPTLRRLSRLAELHMRLGQAKEAERCYRKVLHAMEITQGSSAPGTVAAVDSLARALQARGSLAEAEQLLDRCLAERQRSLGAGHILVGTTLARLGSLAVSKAEAELARGNASEALTQFQLATQLLERAVLIAESNFAHIRGNQLEAALKGGGRKHSGAAQALEKAVTVRPRFFFLVQSLNDLGAAHLRLSHLDIPQKEHLRARKEAEKAFKRCLAVLSTPGLPSAVLTSAEVRSVEANCRSKMAEIVEEKANTSER